MRLHRDSMFGRFFLALPTAIGFCEPVRLGRDIDNYFRWHWRKPAQKGPAMSNEPEQTTYHPLITLDGDAVYDHGNLAGEITDGKFVPSRLLLELDPAAQTAVDKYVQENILGKRSIEEVRAADQAWVDAMNEYGVTIGFLRKTADDAVGYEVTEAGIARQDEVDNQILHLIEMLTPDSYKPHEPMEYDGDTVAEIRELVLDYLKEELGFQPHERREQFEMEFYPYVVLTGDEEPSPLPTGVDYKRLSAKRGKAVSDGL